MTDARERLIEALRKERLSLVPGTPERYPATTVPVRVLDLEALLEETAPDSETRYLFTEKAVERLCEVLNFYGDPFTYFAIAMIGDSPHGDFLDDVEEFPVPGRVD